MLWEFRGEEKKINQTTRSSNIISYLYCHVQQRQTVEQISQIIKRIPTHNWPRSGVNCTVCEPIRQNHRAEPFNQDEWTAYQVFPPALSNPLLPAPHLSIISLIWFSGRTRSHPSLAFQALCGSAWSDYTARKTGSDNHNTKWSLFAVIKQGWRRICSGGGGGVGFVSDSKQLHHFNTSRLAHISSVSPHAYLYSSSPKLEDFFNFLEQFLVWNPRKPDLIAFLQL